MPQKAHRGDLPPLSPFTILASVTKATVRQTGDAHRPQKPHYITGAIEAGRQAYVGVHQSAVNLTTSTQIHVVEIGANGSTLAYNDCRSRARRSVATYSTVDAAAAAAAVVHLTAAVAADAADAVAVLWAKSMLDCGCNVPANGPQPTFGVLQRCVFHPTGV